MVEESEINLDTDFENFKFCFIRDVVVGDIFRYKRAWWSKTSWFEADLSELNDPHDVNLANLNSWIHLKEVMYHMCAVDINSMSGEIEDDG